MAKVAISALPAVVTPNAADVFPVVQSGVTKKLSLSLSFSIPPAIGSATPNTGTFTVLRVGSTTGPTWTTGTGAPVATQPKGSLFARSDGGLGSSEYISRGGGVWDAVLVDSGAVINVKYYGAVGNGSTDDTAAIQTAFTAAASARLPVFFPPGTYNITSPITGQGAAYTNIIGSGRGCTKLVQVTAGQNALSFGLVTPITNFFGMSQIDIQCTGIGATGLQIVFGTGTQVQSFVLQGVQFSGSTINASNYWTNPVIVTNYPYNSYWYDVVAFGGFSFHATDAFTFHATQGAFELQCTNCLSVNYRFGWNFIFDAASPGPSHEGVSLNNCGALVGAGLIRALCTIASYVPPSFVIDSANWQGVGPAVDIAGLGDVVIRDGIWITDTTTTPGRDLFSIDNCEDVLISGNQVALPPGSSGITIFHTKTNPVNIRFSDNFIKNFATIDQIYLFDSTANTNRISEFGTFTHPTGTIVNGAVNDVAGNQASQLAMTQNFDGTVGPDGMMTLRGNETAVTDGADTLTITFPTRPVTGLPWFLAGGPFIVAQLENLAAPGTAFPAHITARSATGFELTLTGSGPGIQWGVSYIAMGL